MAERLSISSTPMREAIRALASEGLLTVNPNRGAEVTDIDEKTLRDSIEVVEYLEAFAGQLAAKRASDQEIGEIQGLTFEMKATFIRKDKLGYYELNQKIHNAILAATHNDTLQAEHRLVNGRLFRIRFKPNDSDERWAMAMAEHEAIAEALGNRDQDRLAPLLREHLSYAWRRSGVMRELGLEEFDD